MRIFCFFCEKLKYVESKPLLIRYISRHIVSLRTCGIIFSDVLVCFVYSLPGNATVARLIEDPELKKVKSAAKALNYAGGKLPNDRHKQLTLIVQKYFNTSELTPEMITETSTIETRKENSNFVSHGQEVVKKVREEGKLLEFEKTWRQHFLDTMHPQYLPPLWSVDHRHDGLKEKLES